VKIQVLVFRFVTPCSVAGGYRRFGGPCCLHVLKVGFLWLSKYARRLVVMWWKELLWGGEVKLHRMNLLEMWRFKRAKLLGFVALPGRMVLRNVGILLGVATRNTASRILISVKTSSFSYWVNITYNVRVKPILICRLQQCHWRDGNYVEQRCENLMSSMVIFEPSPRVQKLRCFIWLDFSHVRKSEQTLSECL
jgi:hypothetical protein